MRSITLGSGLTITGLNLYEKRDAFFADADTYAKAAPAAAAEMAERLGRAARARRSVRLADLGRGLVVVRPSDQRAVVIDAEGGRLPAEQAQVLDQICIHLASVAWKHSNELPSWNKGEILCNALILGEGNQPTDGFWQFANFTGRFSSVTSAQQKKDAFWTREINRVHDWFGQLQKDYPFEALATS